MKQILLQDQIPAEGFSPSVMDSRRVPLERKVILKFHHFGGFFVEYSANVSLTGMFVKTDSPKPAGSILIFEIWLGDEYKLVHGVGEVVWVRGEDETTNRPAGMGVRFLKLDDESRAVVERVIAEHLDKGGEVFDLGDALPAAPADVRADTDRQAELALVEPESRPLSHSDLLVLDEDLLGFDSTPQTAMPEQAKELGLAFPETAARGRGLRVAFFLVVLAVVMGGAAYLFSADLLPF